MITDSGIIPGGCRKYVQAPDMCWNKPFKVRMTKLYNQWLSEDVHQFSEGGNMNPAPTTKRITEWTFDVWSQLSQESIIKSFKYCGLNPENDGREDDFIHCFKNHHI